MCVDASNSKSKFGAWSRGNSWPRYPRLAHHDAIEVTLKTKERDVTAASTDDDHTSESRNALRLPLLPPRPREHKEIFVPGNSATQPRRIDQALMPAVARARSWMRALRQAEFVDTAEIAQRFRLNDAHVRRRLRLVYLALDIAESIVEDRHPRILTVRLLLRGTCGQAPIVSARWSPCYTRGAALF